jgi:steroid 5-alpha reductase family enzyme
VIETWWGLALLAIGVALAAMLLTAYAASRAGRVSVIDVTWGLALSAISVAAAVVGTGTPWRRWVVAGLVLVWGVRLSRHIFTRAKGHGEDPRYAELLGGGGFGTAVRKVYVPQGLAICLLALPVMAAAHWDVVAGWLVWVGVVVWAVGVWFEAVGDALLWWGIWLASGLASGWWQGLVTVLAPLAMTHFLRNVTGAKLLEQTMSQREGWDEYAARVPMFVPRPPRRGFGATGG